MNWWRPDIFKSKIDNLQRRAELLADIRDFLRAREYLEIETTALQASAGIEVHIKAFETELISANREDKQKLFLHTSPEIAMKKLLVAGLPKIFQIAQVFRNAEGSRTHTPSFSMLEWYSTNMNYGELMDEAVDLIRYVTKEKVINWRGKSSDVMLEWEKISVEEAFLKYANTNLADIVGKTEDWEDIFFDIFLDKIEPNLGHPAPTIIYDYPIEMASMSRAKPSNPKLAERFEIYICGLELANAFGELTDAKEMLRRFKIAKSEKKCLYGEDLVIDSEFIEAMKYGMPTASGIALGVDRLAMLLCSADDIKQVQAW